MRTLITKDGKHEVTFMENGGNKRDIIVCASIILECKAVQSRLTDYWYTIGYFKTIKGAVRSAKRQMQEHGYQFNEAEIDSLLNEWYD